MDVFSFIDSTVFTWVVLPILIFLARVGDVSIGTIRLIFISRGYRLVAPLLGFLEVLIWLLAIRQIMQNLANPACFIGYAGGFAVGTYAGMVLEARLAMGTLLIRLITRKDARELIDHLREGGYGVTVVDAEGSSGNVHIIFTVIQRVDLDEVVKILRRFNPKAFYTVEDIRSVSEGVFPMRRTRNRPGYLIFFGLRRKEK